MTRILSLWNLACFFSKSDAKHEIEKEDPGQSVRSISGRPQFSAPVVPRGFEHFIKKAIDGKIVSVDKSYIERDPDNEWWDKLLIPVTINVGSAQGVKEKMLFRLLDKAGFDSSDLVKIRKVNHRSAQGTIEIPVRKNPCVKFSEDDDCSNPEVQPIKPGLVVTTNPNVEPAPADPNL